MIKCAFLSHHPLKKSSRHQCVFLLFRFRFFLFLFLVLSRILFSSQLKPYVGIGQKLSIDQEIALLGKFRGPSGLTPAHFLRVAREHTYAEANPDAPYENPEPPSWMSAQQRLGIYHKTVTGIDTTVPLSKSS